VRIVGCERIKLSDSREVVRVAFKLLRKIENPNGPLDLFCDLDPALGWVITRFKHPIADEKGKVTAFSDFKYVYDGTIGGSVGKLIEVRDYGYRPDGVTPVSGTMLVRVVSFERRELTDKDFTPEAFGVNFSAPDGWPVSRYLLVVCAGVAVACLIWLMLGRRRASQAS
jgi:hypothetical protein